MLRFLELPQDAFAAYTHVVPAGCQQARFHILVEGVLQGFFLRWDRCVSGQQMLVSVVSDEVVDDASLAAFCRLIDPTCDQRRDDGSSHGHTGIDHFHGKRLPWAAIESAKSTAVFSVSSGSIHIPMPVSHLGGAPGPELSPGNMGN